MPAARELASAEIREAYVVDDAAGKWFPKMLCIRKPKLIGFVNPRRSKLSMTVRRRITKTVPWRPLRATL
jgi:hypothetical protein